MNFVVAAALAQQAPPIVNGEATAGYPEVVLLLADAGLCSGSLVAESWALTAGHCVWQAGAVDVYVGTDSENLEQQRAADRWVVHESYVGGAYYDIALVHLASPFDGVPTVAVESGGSGEGALDLVGWGATGDEDDGSSLRKRTAGVSFQSEDAGLLYTWDPSGASNGCYGDSGGPVLRSFGGGYGVVGVMDFVLGGCEGGTLGAARVDVHHAWIAGHADVRSYDGRDTTGGAEGHEDPPETIGEVSTGPVHPARVGQDYAAGTCGTAGAARLLPILVLLPALRRRRSAAQSRE